MTPSQDPKHILLKLFEELEGTKTLPQDEKIKLMMRLQNLGEEQTLTMIEFLQGEHLTMERLKKSLNNLDQELLSSLSEVKQADQHLQKVFLQVREKASSKNEKAEADAMLKSLGE